MKGRSTMTNVFHISEFNTSPNYVVLQVEVICNNVSKACDKLNFGILSLNLAILEFFFPLISFIRLYVEGSVQYVNCNAQNSTQFTATSCVPQGSSLGALLNFHNFKDNKMTLKCNVVSFPLEHNELNFNYALDGSLICRSKSYQHL